MHMCPTCLHLPLHVAYWHHTCKMLSILVGGRIFIYYNSYTYTAHLHFYIAACHASWVVRKIHLSEILYMDV